ncbi:hypothetical protein CBR_g15988 [Chara braunii]|uniref:RRM domain-containing protein n=1 Tax=Chara braunii TaxID=69332 RepID=A0A388JSY3_CHABU|nr:hypothetical protein CBR_g15988 [Chara braunii]|eukprot:GBG60867.1 hypothetical protein CBR_g15988 [Chara braunii]
MEGGASQFDQKVRRTVFLDEIAPQVTVPIMQSALSQFGKVASIKLLHHPLSALVPQGCALIEFSNEEQAMRVAATTRKNLLMVGGMPRPVRVRMASKYMFDTAEVERSNLQQQQQQQQASSPQYEQQQKQEDKEKAKQDEERPNKWRMRVLSPGDPKMEKAQKIKAVRARQAAEMKMLLEKHEEQRAELHRRQENHWEDEHKKLEMIVKAGKHHGLDELRSFFGMGPPQKL